MWFITRKHREQLLDSKSVWCYEIRCLVDALITDSFVVIVARYKNKAPFCYLLPETNFLFLHVQVPLVLLDSSLSVLVVNSKAHWIQIRPKMQFEYFFEQQDRFVIHTIKHLKEKESMQVCVQHKQWGAMVLNVFCIRSEEYLVIMNGIQLQINEHCSLHHTLFVLKQENTRMKAILDQSFDGLCIVEMESLTILHPSTSMRALFPCIRDNSSILPLIDDSSQQEFQRAMKQVQTDGIPISNLQITMLQPKELRIFQVFVIPIHFSYYYYSQAALCLKDVTAQVKLEKEQNNLQLQLSQANALQGAMIAAAFNGTCTVRIETMELIEIIHPFDADVMETISIHDKNGIRFQEGFQALLCQYTTLLREKSVLHNIRFTLNQTKILHAEINMVVMEDRYREMLAIRNITKDMMREENEIRLRKEAETANKNKRDFVVKTSFRCEIGLYIP